MTAGSRLDGALAARDLEAGEVLVDLVDTYDVDGATVTGTHHRTRTVLERIPKGHRLTLRPGGWIVGTAPGEQPQRHCHADGAGPCLAVDCPIAGLGPVTVAGRPCLRACPGAPGPQHPAEARP